MRYVVDVPRVPVTVTTHPMVIDLPFWLQQWPWHFSDKAQYSPPLGQAAGDQYRNEWLSPKSTTIRQTQGKSLVFLYKGLKYINANSHTQFTTTSFKLNCCWTERAKKLIITSVIKLIFLGKSSPISIVQTQSRETQQGSWPKDGSFGSAILRGVGFDSVGNQGGGSGPNSWTDDRNNETAFINKRLQDAQRNNINVRTILFFYRKWLYFIKHRKCIFLQWLWVSTVLTYFFRSVSWTWLADPRNICVSRSPWTL